MLRINSWQNFVSPKSFSCGCLQSSLKSQDHSSPDLKTSRKRDSVGALERTEKKPEDAKRACL